MPDAKLAWAQAWHIRDETYSAALAELVNAQFRHPFAAHWGSGVTSSSDGQRFRAGGKADSTGHVNPKYGAEPGRLHWNDILRLATSIKQGTVAASLMLRKLGSYPRRNGLALALRELGRIERTLFILDRLQNADLRRRVQAGLNKG